MAAHHMDGAELRLQHLSDKSPPGHLHKGRIKGQHQHIIHGIEPGHQPAPILQRIDQRRFHTAEHRFRMGVEGQADRFTAQRIGTLSGQLQQRAMPPVDAVKKTKRNDTVVFHGFFTSKKLFTVWSIPCFALPTMRNAPSGP